MANVKKKDGRTEMFNRTKLERSMRDAGADENIAREVATKVEEREGMTTDEIRKAVTNELRQRKAEIAERYENTKRLSAKKAVDAAKGTARITEDTMNRMNLKAGDNMELMHENKRHTVRAEKASVGRKEIRLHEEDLKVLGAEEGTRIAARRQK